jgi:transposase InsO family protein
MVQYLVTTCGLKCMYMAYTTNPHLPRLRAEAVELVGRGMSVRGVARHFGFSHNAVLNWLKRKPEYGFRGRLEIPTRSSKPLHHPGQLKEEIVSQILSLRQERNQCAEIIQYRLKNEFGIQISLSSVKRTLRRNHISRFSKWKRWHAYPSRPLPEKPGILVQIDTIMDGMPSDRLCIYSLIDVCSRWAYALPLLKPSSRASARFVLNARETAPFSFQTIQSDHGGEFSKWFTKVVNHQGILHRHSRVRKPTDNGHIERFNRTLQEECLVRLNRDLKSWQKGIPEYLHYYNFERPHMGLEFKSPMQVVRSY